MDEAVNYIVLAIPFFFFLIGVEVVASFFLRKKYYRLNDSVNDLSMGIIDQVGGAFINASLFILYMYIWDNYRIFDMGATTTGQLIGIPIAVWVITFLVRDMQYYWAHRMSHTMNIGWATHIAHHQSEEYNLSVALRQGVFQGFFFYFFYWPMALIGFPPMVWMVCGQFNTIYQFWIHTRAIGKLGPVEWVLNTPSHHRVHHGRDPKYIDKNHAGVFIIWDRMFGSFVEEEEEPHFGLATPLQSWNPLWAQVHYFVKLFKLAWKAPKWTDKIKLWFMPPAWAPEGIKFESAQKKWEQGEYQVYDTKTPRMLNIYAALHFVPILLLSTGFVLAEGSMVAEQRALAAILIFWTLLNLGGIFEARKWLIWSEIYRIETMLISFLLWGPALFALPTFLESIGMPRLGIDTALYGAPFLALNLSIATVSFLCILLNRSYFVVGYKELPALPIVTPAKVVAA